MLIINISNSNNLNKFTKCYGVSQCVSQWVSHWQAFPMIGLWSDKKQLRDSGKTSRKKAAVLLDFVQFTSRSQVVKKWAAQYSSNLYILFNSSWTGRGDSQGFWANLQASFSLTHSSASLSIWWKQLFKRQEGLVKQDRPMKVVPSVPTNKVSLSVQRLVSNFCTSVIFFNDRTNTNQIKNI